MIIVPRSFFVFILPECVERSRPSESLGKKAVIQFILKRLGNDAAVRVLIWENPSLSPQSYEAYLSKLIHVRTY